MFWRQLAEGESRVCAAVIRRVTQFFPSFAPIRVRAQHDDLVVAPLQRDLDRVSQANPNSFAHHQPIDYRFDGVTLAFFQTNWFGAIEFDNFSIDARAHPNGCETWEELRYSTNYGSADSGFTLGELTPKHFSFNSHLGACPACHGFGTQPVIDPELMISDETKTIAEGRIPPWRRRTERMQAYYRQLQGALVKHFQVDEDVPFADLPDAF